MNAPDLLLPDVRARAGYFVFKHVDVKHPLLDLLDNGIARDLAHPDDYAGAMQRHRQVVQHCIAWETWHNKHT